MSFSNTIAGLEIEKPLQNYTYMFFWIFAAINYECLFNQIIELFLYTCNCFVFGNISKKSVNVFIKVHSANVTPKLIAVNTSDISPSWGFY